MTQADFVYDQVYKGCKSAGVDELTSKNAAVTTVQKYKNNQFTKVTALMKSAVTDAKKIMAKKKRK